MPIQSPRRVQRLFDLEPWDPGPQSLVRDNAPVPDSRRRMQAGVGGPAPYANPASPFVFPVPAWNAEAHRYAYCSNLVLAYGNAVSTKVIDAPVSFRNLLAIRNLSTTQTVAVQFGSDASANSALQLAPGAFVLFDSVVPQDDLYLFGTTGAGSVAIMVSTVSLPPVPVPT